MNLFRNKLVLLILTVSRYNWFYNKKTCEAMTKFEMFLECFQLFIINKIAFDKQLSFKFILFLKS